MNKIYDFNIMQRNEFSHYEQLYSNSVTQAQNYISNNNLQENALLSDNINQLLQPVSGLQNSYTDKILKYIGLPPIQWVMHSKYKIGDIVYINNIDDSILYYCIKNIDNSINLANTQYWQPIQNYYNNDNSLNKLFQFWIDNFKIQNYPLWDSSKIYYKNDIVNTNDNYRAICITTNIQGTTQPLESEDWIVFDLTGQDGSLSLGVDYQGEWISNFSYEAKVMVKYTTGGNTSLYISKENIDNSTVSPSEDTRWEKIYSSSQAYIPVVTQLPANLNSLPSVFCQIIHDEVNNYFYVSFNYKDVNNNIEIMYPRVKCSKILLYNLYLFNPVQQVRGNNYFNNTLINLYYSKNLIPGRLDNFLGV